MEDGGFNGMQVLGFESRRAKELATLIEGRGGVATVVPAMRELPLESNSEALAFAENLIADRYSLVIFLTGVGARRLFSVAETRFSPMELRAALRRARIAVRGPKPVAALRELGLQADIAAKEPSTWRELLTAVDTAYGDGLRGVQVAVQEYGETNQDLLRGLEERGAVVTRVPTYRWALPEDLGELLSAIDGLIEDRFDAVIFLTGVQAAHLFEVAERAGKRDALLNGLSRSVVASIGPDTTEELSRLGVSPSFQPSHPRMGVLVSELAKKAADLVRVKRAI